MKEEVDKLNQIEICPQAMELTESISKRISSDGGGALIIDYGRNGVVSDSLQVQISLALLRCDFSDCLILIGIMTTFYFVLLLA